jgi:hypothetical protein
MLSSFSGHPFRLLSVWILAACILCALVPIGAVTGAESTPHVKVIKTPHEGIQPQALFDSKGVLHLLYFKG